MRRLHLLGGGLHPHLAPPGLTVGYLCYLFNIVYHPCCTLLHTYTTSFVLSYHCPVYVLLTCSMSIKHAYTIPTSSHVRFVYIHHATYMYTFFTYNTYNKPTYTTPIQRVCCLSVVYHAHFNMLLCGLCLLCT